MRRKRTVGNRVWIGLLGFSLLVLIALDSGVIYVLLWTKWMRPIEALPGLAYLLWMTQRTYGALHRRLSISGADSFFS